MILLIYVAVILSFIIVLARIALRGLKKNLITKKRVLLSLFYYLLFSVTFFFAFGFFYEFFFDNEKKLLSIKSLNLLDEAENYFDVNEDLNGNKVAFYFDEQKNLLKVKNLDKGTAFAYDVVDIKNNTKNDSPANNKPHNPHNPHSERERLFIHSTPFVDLDYRTKDLQIKSLVLRDKAGKLQNKIEVKRVNEIDNVQDNIKALTQIFPEKGSYHSYTFSDEAVIFSQKKEQDKFIKIYYNKEDEASSLTPTLPLKTLPIKLDLVGHDYYPYYWRKKNILYFINVNVGQIEGKNTYLYNLVHYDFLKERVLFNTFLGGDEKLNLRSFKISGDIGGNYLAYGTFDKDNTLYFFYYPNEMSWGIGQENTIPNSMQEPVHFFLKFDILANIYSFIFETEPTNQYHDQSEHGTEKNSTGKNGTEKRGQGVEEVSLLMVAQEKGASKVNKSIYQAKLAISPTPTLQVDYVFAVFAFLLVMGGMCLTLSFMVLRLRKK